MSIEEQKIAPSLGDPDDDVDWDEHRPVQTAEPDRPLLLSIVAIVMLLSGIAGILVVLYSWGEFVEIGGYAEQGPEWPYAFLVMWTVSVLGGIFILFGVPVGWYFAIFGLVQSLVTAVFTWMTVHEKGVSLTLWAGDTISVYTKLGGRAILTLLFIGYFFQNSVRRYCEISLAKGFSAITVFVGIEVVIYVFDLV